MCSSLHITWQEQNLGTHRDEWHKFVKSQMSLLSPNKQCQRIGGSSKQWRPPVVQPHRFYPPLLPEELCSLYAVSSVRVTVDVLCNAEWFDMNWCWCTYTLLCLCGSVVYTSSDVGRRNSAALDSAKYCCQCQSACILPHARVQRRVNLRRVSASVTAVDVQGRTHVPCDGVACSARCAARLTTGR